MVSIKFSKNANALYVQFEQEHKRIANTISIGNDRFLDVDEAGNVLGIELLSKDLPEEAYEAIQRINSIELTS